MNHPELRAFLDEWEAAYTGNNVDALADMYEDDVLFAPHGFKVIDGKKATVDLLSSISASHRVEIRQEIDHVSEDGDILTAVGRAYAVLFDKESNEEVARDAARWLILLKRGGNGKLRMYRDFSQPGSDVVFD